MEGAFGMHIIRKLVPDAAREKITPAIIGTRPVMTVPGAWARALNTPAEMRHFLGTLPASSHSSSTTSRLGKALGDTFDPSFLSAPPPEVVGSLDDINLALGDDTGGKLAEVQELLKVRPGPHVCCFVAVVWMRRCSPVHSPDSHRRPSRAQEVLLEYATDHNEGKGRARTTAERGAVVRAPAARAGADAAGTDVAVASISVRASTKRSSRSRRRWGRCAWSSTRWSRQGMPLSSPLQPDSSRHNLGHSLFTEPWHPAVFGLRAIYITPTGYPQRC